MTLSRRSLLRAALGAAVLAPLAVRRLAPVEDTFLGGGVDPAEAGGDWPAWMLSEGAGGYIVPAGYVDELLAHLAGAPE